MKKILVVPTLTILTCVPLTAQSWWGPCGGGGAPHPYAAAPYWGGYAPPMYAPPYPAYAPPPGYAKPWRRGPDDRYDDFGGPDDKNMFDSTDADRKEEIESRRAAFRARAEARKAEMNAKRDAWRQQIDQMGPMDRYSGKRPSETTAVEPELQTPPVEVTPAEPPKNPAAATTKP